MICNADDHVCESNDDPCLDNPCSNLYTISESMVPEDYPDSYEIFGRVMYEITNEE